MIVDDVVGDEPRQAAAPPDRPPSSPSCVRRAHCNGPRTCSCSPRRAPPACSTIGPSWASRCSPSSPSASPPAASTCGTTPSTSQADRRHPTKRLRPIAAGQLGIGTAKVVGTSLLVAVLRRRRGDRPVANGGRHCHLHRHDDRVQRLAQARRRRRSRPRRLRVRAARRRRRRRCRRPDVEVVRAVHRVRLTVHRHRQALCGAA